MNVEVYRADENANYVTVRFGERVVFVASRAWGSMVGTAVSKAYRVWRLANLVPTMFSENGVGWMHFVGTLPTREVVVRMDVWGEL